MTENECTHPADQPTGKVALDWDTPTGQALIGLMQSVQAAQDVRSAVAKVEASLKSFEFQLQSSIFKVRDEFRKEARERAEGSPFPLNASGLVSQSEVIMALDITKATLAALRRDERFPEAIYVSPKKAAYRKVDLDFWLHTQRKRVALRLLELR